MMSLDWGESSNKLEEEFSERKEDELLDGARTAEIEGFSKSKWSEDIEENKSKKK